MVEFSLRAFAISFATALLSRIQTTAYNAYHTWNNVEIFHPVPPSIEHLRAFGPYTMDLFTPQLHIVNSEYDMTSYCPATDLIDLVAQYHQMTFYTCKDPNFVTPETWNLVVATNTANKKALPSISQVYSNSVIGIRYTSSNMNITPNRTPLHMLAIYTRRMSDSCVNPDFPAAGSEEQIKENAEVKGSLSRLVEDFMSRCFSSLSIHVISDIGTRGCFYLTICKQLYTCASVVCFTLCILSIVISHSCALCSAKKTFESVVADTRIGFKKANQLIIDLLFVIFGSDITMEIHFLRKDRKIYGPRTDTPDGRSSPIFTDSIQSFSQDCTHPENQTREFGLLQSEECSTPAGSNFETSFSSVDEVQVEHSFANLSVPDMKVNRSVPSISGSNEMVIQKESRVPQTNPYNDRNEDVCTTPATPCILIASGNRKLAVSEKSETTEMEQTDRTTSLSDEQADSKYQSQMSSEADACDDQNVENNVLVNSNEKHHSDSDKQSQEHSEPQQLTPRPRVPSYNTDSEISHYVLAESLPPILDISQDEVHSENDQDPKQPPKDADEHIVALPQLYLANELERCKDATYTERAKETNLEVADYVVSTSDSSNNLLESESNVRAFEPQASLESVEGEIIEGTIAKPVFRSPDSQEELKESPQSGVHQEGDESGDDNNTFVYPGSELVGDGDYTLQEIAQVSVKGEISSPDTLSYCGSSSFEVDRRDGRLSINNGAEKEKTEVLSAKRDSGNISPSRSEETDPQIKVPTETNSMSAESGTHHSDSSILAIDYTNHQTAYGKLRNARRNKRESYLKGPVDLSLARISEEDLTAKIHATLNQARTLPSCDPPGEHVELTPDRIFRRKERKGQLVGFEKTHWDMRQKIREETGKSEDDLYEEVYGMRKGKSVKKNDRSGYHVGKLRERRTDDGKRTLFVPKENGRVLSSSSH